MKLIETGAMTHPHTNIAALYSSLNIPVSTPQAKGNPLSLEELRRLVAGMVD